MRHTIIIFSVLALILLSACKTTRTVPVAGPAKNKMRLAQLIEKIQLTQPQFNTANVSKMSMAFEMNERKVNVSATCRVKKDSAIYLSVQPFMGIELFKAELTTDSMWIFDKMNNRYYVVDYGFFSKRFGVEVDFYSLQALLFGQFFCVGAGKDIPTDSCKLSVLPSGVNRIDFERGSMSQSTDISTDYWIQQVVLKSKNSDYQLHTKYEEYTLSDSVNFPQEIALKATGQKSNASCDFSILRVEFNPTIKFTPTNTARYTRGDIEQLLKK